MTGSIRLVHAQARVEGEPPSRLPRVLHEPRAGRLPAVVGQAAHRLGVARDLAEEGVGEGEAGVVRVRRRRCAKLNSPPKMPERAWPKFSRSRMTAGLEAYARRACA